MRDKQQDNFKNHMKRYQTTKGVVVFNKSGINKSAYRSFSRFKPETQISMDYYYFLRNCLCLTEGEARWVIAEPKKYNTMKDGRYIKCFDICDRELHDGDCVDVQKSGVHKIYSAKGQLCFTPYGKEECVWKYFSNDMVKCDSEGNWI